MIYIYTRLCLAATLFIVFAAAPVTARQCDPWEHRQLDRMNLHLRWENIEGTPRWVEGVRPVFNRRKRLHIVTLPPGGSVTLQMDEGEMLRCLTLNRPLEEDEIVVTRSNGSGLQVRHYPRWSEKRRWFLAQSPLPEPALFKITNPVSAVEDQTLSFFAAKYEVPARIAQYLRPLIPVEKKKQGYHRLNPGETLELQLKGPLRLRLETRLIYLPDVSRTRQRYRLQCRIDDGLYRDLEFRTTLDRGIPLWKDDDGNHIPVGYRRFAVMEIPEGKHRLRYTSAVPLYLDIWAADSQGEPELLPEENRALELLKTTGYRETGLAAAAQMQESLAPDGKDRDGLSTGYRTSAIDIWNHHTFYRPLLPWRKDGKNGKYPQVTAAFFSRRLLPLEQIGYPLTRVFFSQFLADDVQNRPTGIFFPVPSTPSPKESVYPLPGRSVPSRLRVAVLRSNSTKPVHLQLQMDDRPPIPLILQPRPDGPDNRLEADSAEALKALLATQSHIPHQYNTTPTHSAAEAELFLPPGVKTIRISSSSPQTTGPVYASLSYRASRPYRLSETEYLRALELHGSLEGFKDQLKKQPTQNALRPLEQEFKAHHQPLVRLLHSRQRIFSNGLTNPSSQVSHQASLTGITSLPEGLSGVQGAPPLGPRRALGEPPEARQQKVKKQALKYESQSQWLNALENWNHLVHATEGKKRQQALRGRLRALVKMDEPFLTEQQLKGAILFENNQETRNEAIKLLSQLYQTTGDREKLLNLRAVEVLQNPTKETLSRFTEALVQNNQMDLALQAGMFLINFRPNENPTAPGVSVKTLENLLTAALNTRMYEIYNQLCRILPPGHCSYWTSIGRVARGQYKTPLDFLAKLTYILTQYPLNQTQWIPEDVSHLIRDSAGATHLYTIDRDLYAPHHRAEPNRPAIIKAQGPVSLKLQLRNVTGKCLRRLSEGQGGFNGCSSMLPPLGTPLSLRESALGPISVEVTVEGCDEPLVIPVRRFPRSEALEVIGPPEQAFQVGIKEELPLELGPGIHRIAVTPDYGAVLVQLSAQRPALPLLRHNINPAAIPPTPTAPLTTQTKPKILLVSNSQIAQKTTISRSDSGVPRGGSMLLHPLNPPWPSESRRRHTNGIRSAAMATGETTWEPVTAIVNSAGLAPVTVTGWEPETPGVRIRRALMPPVSKEQMVSTTSDTLRVEVRFLEPKKLAVDISTVIPDYLEQHPLPVECRLDGVPVKTVTAVPGNQPQTVRFTVPAGRHIISLHPRRHQPNHFIQARFTKEDDGRPLLPSREITRLYYVSTHREPLHLKVEGPALLRVDRLEQSKSIDTLPPTLSQQVTVPENVSDVYLLPGGQVAFNSPGSPDSSNNTVSPGSGHTLYRVFREVPGTETTPLPGIEEDIIPLESTPYPETAVKTIAQDKPVKFHDAIPPGGQEDGTWTASMEYRQYHPFLEEGGVVDEDEILDRYTQLTLTRRFYNPYKNRYNRTELFTRIRQDKHPTFGLAYRLYLDPRNPKSPLVFDLGGSALLQKPSREPIPNANGLTGSDDFKRDGNTQFSLKAQGRVRFQHRIDSQVMHLPALAIFARYLSASPNEYAGDWFQDPDVYTRYKTQHRYGLVIEDLLVIRPWETTRWWLGASVTSNESLNPFKPDYITGRFLWKQNIGWGQVDFQYRLRRYFKDEHRGGSYYSQLVAIQFNLDIWLKNRQRLELGTRFSWDWGLEESSFSLYLSWHLNRGRGYRDFNPPQLDFKEQKERRLLFKSNLESNRIGDTPCP